MSNVLQFPTPTNGIQNLGTQQWHWVREFVHRIVHPEGGKITHLKDAPLLKTLDWLENIYTQITHLQTHKWYTFHEFDTHVFQTVWIILSSTQSLEEKRLELKVLAEAIFEFLIQHEEASLRTETISIFGMALYGIQNSISETKWIWENPTVGDIIAFFRNQWPDDIQWNKITEEDFTYLRVWVEQFLHNFRESKAHKQVA